MGEAKRRRKLDPNYGKRPHYLFIDAGEDSAALGTNLSVTIPQGKLDFGEVMLPGSDLDKIAKQLSTLGSTIPSGCSGLPIVFNEIYPGMFFTKQGYSRCMFTAKTNPPPQTQKFLRSNELNLIALELFQYCMTVGRVNGDLPPP